ncbi:MAG: hypothetical protein M1823_001134 [Watsoniomyces obsoletus]|nr:MAG: hypothetical protein M1823_001134 [Watsoniomyces obsoletus]
MRLFCLLLLFWTSSISCGSLPFDNQVKRLLTRETQEQRVYAAQDEEQKVNRLLSFLKRPDVLPLVTFIVGVGSLPLLNFAREVVSGRRSAAVPSRRGPKVPAAVPEAAVREAAPEACSQTIPDECSSLDDPQTSAPDFQQAGGGFDPKSFIMKANEDELNPEQRAQYKAFKEGLSQGDRVLNNRERMIHLQGVKDGYEDAGDIAVPRHINFFEAAEMYGKGYDRRDRQSLRFEGSIEPKTERDKELYKIGHQRGFTITQARQEHATRKIVAGYARGLCVKRCLMAEEERWRSLNPAHTPGSGGTDELARDQDFILGLVPVGIEDTWILRCIEREKRRQLDRLSSGEPDYDQYYNPPLYPMSLMPSSSPVTAARKGRKKENVEKKLKTDAIELGKTVMEGIKKWKPPSLSSFPGAISRAAAAVGSGGGGRSLIRPKWVPRGPIIP